MIKEYKVKITRKDLYSKDYSNIDYLNIKSGECIFNKSIVTIFIKMMEDLN